MSHRTIVSDRFGQTARERSAAAHTQPSTRRPLGRPGGPGDMLRDLGPDRHASNPGTGIVANATGCCPSHRLTSGSSERRRESRARVTGEIRPLSKGMTQ